MADPLKKWFDKLNIRGERGVSSIEYVGLAMVVVAILGAMLVALNGGATVGDAFGNRIGSLISGWGGDAGSGAVGGTNTARVLDAVGPGPVSGEGVEPLAEMMFIEPAAEAVPSAKLKPLWEDENTNLDPRLRSARDALKATTNGSELAKWLEDRGMPIEFGATTDDALAQYDPKTRKIVIREDLADAPPETLAPLIAHEAVHAKHYNPLSIPILGNLVNVAYTYLIKNPSYVAYPFPEEYEAYKAEAEVWKEMRSNAPRDSKMDGFLDGHVSLIYDADGKLKDKASVYRELYEKGYEGVFYP